MSSTLSAHSQGAASAGAFGLGFQEPISAFILGGRGGIGSALTTHILESHPANRVFYTTRATQTLERSAPSAGLRARQFTLDMTDELSWEGALERLDAALTSRGEV